MTSTFMKGLLLVVMLTMFNACEEDKINESNCDALIALDADKYQNGATDFYTIVHSSIIDNCLEIEYSASGCDGASWTVEMVDAEVVLESFPIQRNLKMLLDNKEACQAVFTKKVSFDLTPIQTESYSKIILNIDGYEEPLLYDYSNDTSIENQIQQKWDLINVNGGLTGIDQGFPVGSITWDFGKSDVTVVNNNPLMNALYDGLASGTYDYIINEENDFKSLIVDDQNFGEVYISNDELILENRAADGFQLRFQKH